MSKINLQRFRNSRANVDDNARRGLKREIVNVSRERSISYFFIATSVSRTFNNGGSYTLIVFETRTGESVEDRALVARRVSCSCALHVYPINVRAIRGSLLSASFKRENHLPRNNRTLVLIYAHAHMYVHRYPRRSTCGS